MEKDVNLETKRLVIRSPRASDIPRIVKFANNSKVADMTLNIPFPYEEKDAIFWINNANQGLKDESQFTCAICQKPTNEFIGGIGLGVNRRFNRAELGFWIAEPFWNNGFATEAVGEIIKFGFEEIELNKILATHLPNNPASAKVMAKNGMVREGELKEHVRKNEKYLSLIQYRITRNEFLNRS